MILGSIIALKKESEEQYIALHRHPFPEVLQEIRRSNISDYSIFLDKGLLFSHMIYSGSDYRSDMAAMAADPDTREWWKLTDPMQQPFDERKEGEWWASAELWYEADFPVITNDKTLRTCFRVPVNHAVRVREADDLFGDIRFWGEAYALKCLRIFRTQADFFVYAETHRSSDIQSLAGITARVLNPDSVPAEMKEVFHTGFGEQIPGSSAKKVFVTGCFDMLHSGHIAFLQEAASYGDLYVSIGSDENVHHLKGRYPVNTQDERKYMIDALSCVKKCMINSGRGYIDFAEEIAAVRPDIFIVNEDGHTPAKQVLCGDLGIAYQILKRLPYADLPVRSTTMLRTECTIPFRIDLAGGWLDQPFVSELYPGSVLTVSIEPTIEFNDRSGMASSTRRKAIELWRNEIPHGDAEHQSRILFSFENPPGTKAVSGSQDSLGIVLPGLNKLSYEGSYWPSGITSVYEEEILSWIEDHLCLVTLGPRESSYDPLSDTRIDAEGAKALSVAADQCWQAILSKDLMAFGAAFRESFEAQIRMFPEMADPEILRTIELYSDKSLGWKLSGAGGGGYIILVCETPLEGSMQIRIRRKNSL
jgi:cytidyltransferase-like protein